MAGVESLLSLIEEAAQTYQRFAVLSRVTGPDLLELQAPRDRLAKRIAVEPEFQLPSGELLWVGGEGFQIGPEAWAAWAGPRAAEVGAKQVLAEMKQYVATEGVPCEQVLGLKGLVPDRPVELAEGIRFVPLSSIENPFGSPLQLLAGPDPYTTPDSALVAQRTAKKALGRPSHQPIMSDLWDVALCLTLVGPSAPTPVAEWNILPAWVPRWGTTRRGLGPAKSPFGVALREEHYQQARDICLDFRGLSRPAQNKLRVPLARLRSAIGEPNVVDAAIDLGIAIEAIFLPDAQQELAFRVSIRAGWYLGGDRSENRRDKAGLFHDLYSLRSQAVHQGKLPGTHKGNDTRQLLKDGFDQTAAALKRAIADGGFPDWDAIVYG